MRLAFLGNHKKLVRLISKMEVDGIWRELKNGHMQFHADDGAVLNWWRSTGTVTFQGRKPKAQEFERSFLRRASKKGLIEHETGPEDELAELKRQLKGALIDIAKLKEAIL